MIRGAWPRCWHTLAGLPSVEVTSIEPMNWVEGQAVPNIIKFPGGKQNEEGAPVDAPKAVSSSLSPRSPSRIRAFMSGLVRVLWTITVLVWPVLKWVISISAAFQLMRTLYYWNTPDVHAGWVFLLHFFVLTALTYFVSIYKPKGA